MDGGAGSVKTIVGRPGATLPLHAASARSEEHTSELQSQSNLVCRLLLEKKKKNRMADSIPAAPFLPSLLLVALPTPCLRPVTSFGPRLCRVPMTAPARVVT